MKLNHLMLGSASMLIGSLALAGTLNLDMRFDSDATAYNTGAQNSVSTNQAAGTTNPNIQAPPSNNRMYLQTGRLDYKGKFNDDIGFRTRLRFNQIADTNLRSQAGSFVDFAYVNNKFNDNYDITIGKQFTDMAGFEGMTSPADLYFQSVGFRAASIYASGLRASGHWGDQNVDLVVFDDLQKDSTNDSGRADHGRVTYGAIYKGMFLDKALSAMVSYHLQSPGATNGVTTTNGLNGVTGPTNLLNGATSASQKSTYITGGLKYVTGGWYGQVDYNSFTFNDNSSTGNNDTVNGFVVNTGYKFTDAHIGRLLYENTAAKTYAFLPTATSVSDGTLTTQTIGAVYEYHPYNDDMFRYHLAYTMSSAVPSGSGFSNAAAQAAGSATDTRSETHIIAGVRILADFLK